jgi:hypothetical protein
MIDFERRTKPAENSEVRVNPERLRQRQRIREYLADHREKLSHLPTTEAYDDLPEVNHWNMAAVILLADGAKLPEFGTGKSLRESHPKPEEGQVITGKEVVNELLIDTFSAYYPPHTRGQGDTEFSLGIHPSVLVYERDRSPGARGPKSRGDLFMRGGLAFKVPTETDSRDPEAMIDDDFFGDPYVILIEDGINQEVLPISNPRSHAILRAVDEAAYKVLEDNEKAYPQPTESHSIGHVAVQHASVV